MVIEYIISAIILGFIVAIPPGSVTIIACQRAIQFGFKNSMIFSLASGISDVFYILLVYIGVANIISANIYYKITLWTICGLILILLGLTSIIGIIKKGKNEQKIIKLQTDTRATIISGIVVTLTNPMTIVGWLAIAGNFFLIWNEKFPKIREYGIISIILIMIGVYLWFFPLVYMVSRFQKIFNEKIKTILIIISNGFLILFGLSAFYYVFTTLQNA